MTENETIFVKILTPEKPFLVKEVLSVEIPAVDGPYQVLPRRAPAMKLLTNGIVVLTEEGNKTEKYFITAGSSKIRDDSCTVLVKEAIDVETADLPAIKKRLSVYEEKLKKGGVLDLLEAEKAAFLQMIVGYFEKRTLS